MKYYYFMGIWEQLRMRRCITLKIEKNAIVDIRGIRMPDRASAVERARQFFEEIKNPYVFKVDDIIVHVEFGEKSAGSLQSHIQNLLSSMI